MVLSTHQTKTATLILSLALLVMSFFDAPLVLEPHCSVTARMAYHFFHANFFHALCNIWCLLALAFYYDIEDWELLLAYIIAATIPSWALSPLHSLLSPVKAVGFSGICFALMGIVFHKVARKRYYLSWIIPIVAVGFFIPGMAAGVHLYCFTIGIIVSLVLYCIARHRLVRKERP